MKDDTPQLTESLQIEKNALDIMGIKKQIRKIFQTLQALDAKITLLEDEIC